MSFGDHLDELRKRVLLAVAVPLPLAVLLFLVAEPIRNFMCRPLVFALQTNRLPVQLQALNPIETVMIDMKLGLILGLIISAPWILYQGWLFIAPGLFRNERRFVQFLLPASGVLTILGVSLLYWLMLPLMLRVLVGFGVSEGPLALPPPRSTEAALVAPSGGEPPTMVEPSPPREIVPALTIPMLLEHPPERAPGSVYIKIPEHMLCVVVEEAGTIETLMTPLSRATLVAQQYRLSEYVNFVLLMSAAMAVTFQTPLVILLLGWIGILRLETLRANRKYALMGCAVVSAIITPPDAVSMMLTLVPLYLLYEVGMLLLQWLPASRIAGATDPARDESTRPRSTTARPKPVPAPGAVSRTDGAEGDT